MIISLITQKEPFFRGSFCVMSEMSDNPAFLSRDVSLVR